MSIKPEFFDYLRHMGQTVTLRELHRNHAQPHCVGLRHDIDLDLDLALEVAHHEHELGYRATYFLLHTNDYFDDDRFLIKCRQLKEYGHEVGLHLNVLTRWIQGAGDDIEAELVRVLGRLRESGVEIVGTSAHGDRACYEHRFINYWIWRELRPDDPVRTENGLCAEGIPLDDPHWQIPYPADHRLARDDGRGLGLWSASLSDHGLEYDASHLPVDHYWTDTGGQWLRSGDPISADLSTGRHQVLMHPQRWRAEQRLVFALSTARSGSTWLANFVDRATSCRGLHEYTLNHRQSEQGMVQDKRTTVDYVGLMEDRALAARLIYQAVRYFRTLRPDVLEANVYFEPFIDILKAEAPDACLIHLHRDGRDVVRSILDRNWYDTPVDRRHRPVDSDGTHDPTQFEYACRYYRHTNEAIARHAQKRLSFERMVRDLDYLTGELRSLGIVVHPLLAAEEFPRKINAAKGRRSPPFEDWSEDYRRTFEAICGPVQRGFGYASEEFGGRTDEPASRDHTPPAPGRTVLELDLVRQDPPDTGKVNVLCRRCGDGLLVQTTSPGVASSHLLLATGRSAEVQSRHGIAADPCSYYVCEVVADTAPELAARVFVLFFDHSGRQIARNHVATIRPDAPKAIGSFVPAAGSSHFALVLHLGDNEPEQALTVKSILVTAFPLGERYRAMLNPPETKTPETPETSEQSFPRNMIRTMVGWLRAPR